MSLLEVDVAQLLLIPEVRGSNPVIGKNLLISNNWILSTVYWKDENKEKDAGNGPFLKNMSLLVYRSQTIANVQIGNLMY